MMSSNSVKFANSFESRVTNIFGTAEKQVFRIGNCKGIITRSHPRKFRMWIYIDDIQTSAEVFADSIEAGTEKLIEEIARLRQTVPVRRELFERIETALKEKFTVMREGYEFLNAQERFWRSASNDRLRELCETVEALAGTMQYPFGLENSAAQNAEILETGDFSCPRDNSNARPSSGNVLDFKPRNNRPVSILSHGCDIRTL